MGFNNINPPLIIVQLLRPSTFSKDANINTVFTKQYNQPVK